MLRRLLDAKSRFAAVPYPVWALAVCLLAAAVGVAALDDYGITADEREQRITGQVNFDYALGQSDELLSFYSRDHQAAFELALVAAERALGLEDLRDIYLSRRLLSHLFFIAGGFFAGLLVYRMFGNRWLALFALLLFLLHPRLYAHSFFNTKDLPFLSMLMIALYLTHRAFRRDTLGAFILCGVAVGLLTNIRIMGLMLFPAVIAMRGLDLGYEFRRPERRRRLLLTAAAFALAAILTLYLTWPWLWDDPLARFIEAFRNLSNYPQGYSNLFRGELSPRMSPPWDYIPVWASISTPPAAWLLALAGMAAVAYGTITHPGEILRNTSRRFELLLLACLLLPPAAVIALDSTLYDGWRHSYFIYTPLCLLAVIGLRWLLGAAGKVGQRPAAMRAGVYGLAAIGLAAAAFQGAQLHPYQQLYFNFLADRNTPNHLLGQYDLDYWSLGNRQAIDYLLESYPEAAIRATAPGEDHFVLMLPAEQRQRVQTVADGTAPADFFITKLRHYTPPIGNAELFAPVIQRLQVYHNTLTVTAALDLSLVDEATADSYRERYQAVVSGEPIARSEFDVYLQGRTLSLVKESCAAAQLGWGFTIAVYPADLNELPGRHRQRGWLGPHYHPPVRFDGKCFVQPILPEGELLRIRVTIGRFAAPEEGQPAAAIPPWEWHYFPGAADTLAELHRLRQAETRPAIRAQWDVFRYGERLLYARPGCTAEERETPFFLHLTPAETGDLPEQRRRYGYDNLDFRFARQGLMLGDECIALVPLPDYPITAVTTGQYTDAGRLWQATMNLR